MIRINTLYSLSEISDCYYINLKGEVINAKTNYIKIQTLGKRGYYYVSLNKKNTNKPVKVPIHKIIALAFINNGPYECINHIDGNKKNNSINNLEFCSQRYNVQHAWNNKLIIRTEKLFNVLKTDNSIISGTMKELSKILNIPKGTLYDLFYKQKGSSKYNIISITNKG